MSRQQTPDTRNQKTDISWEPIAQIAKQVNSTQVSARSLVEKSLKAIEQFRGYNAIITVAKVEALDRADEIDKLVKQGKSAGKLAGVPFIAKDNYLTKGVKTTAASNILKDYIPPYNATVIEKLEAQGAIMVAKSNLDAFAHGSSTENSDFGPTLNPYDKNRVPGGSSGGSGAAVALGLAPFALGSDTGGSIRLPASFCGVVGLKPTYGLVSRFGVIAMGSSTDVMGPITNNIADAAYVLDIMAGSDINDATTINRETDYTKLNIDIKQKTFGVIKEHMGEGLDDGVRKLINGVVEKLKNAGATVKEISIPDLNYALAVYYIVVPAEVSSNLLRYDGIKYGMSIRQVNNLKELYARTRSQGFNSENKRRIMMGTYVLSSGYYDAYYKKAQTVRTKLINEFNHAFSQVDILIGPTAPNTAFKLGENISDPLKMYLSDIMTVGANLVGCPAISIPVGFADNMPVGLQLMAPQQKDKLLLSVSQAIEDLNK